MEPATIASVAFAFISGLFAFLSLWAKLKYDADRTRLEAKVDELTRDNADLKQQLEEERSERKRLAGVVASLSGGRSATPEAAYVTDLENQLAIHDPAFAARLEIKRKAGL